jgi:hypothetical protein
LLLPFKNNLLPTIALLGLSGFAQPYPRIVLGKTSGNVVVDQIMIRLNEIP